MKTRLGKSWVRVGSLLAVLFLGVDRVRAGDWYVDATSGSDANDGLSPATAWRTITHAFAAIPSQPPLVAETIHVAGGIYDSANGEVYPIVQRPLTRIVGAQVGTPTILDGGASSSVLDYYPDPVTPMDERTGADWLTLRNAGTGIKVISYQGGNSSPSFSDLRIQNMTSQGVLVEADLGFSCFCSGDVWATLERVEVSDCGTGIRVRGAAGHFDYAFAGADVIQCTVRSSIADGIAISASGNGSAHVNLRECRILGNGRHGVYSSAVGSGETSTTVNVNTTLVAGNQDSGLFGAIVDAAHGYFSLTDCTIANNVQAGVRGTYYIEAQLRNSIVAGNGDDIDLVMGVGAQYSASTDGALLGIPGCITADPLFMNPGAGDFRLRFGSPCIDRGEPAAAQRQDLLGHPRQSDGDLSARAAADMGAFEFQPLRHIGTPHVGGSIRFEMWGQPGAQARLWYSRLPLIDPISTPLGSLYMDGPSIAQLGTYTLGNSLPKRLYVLLPNDPILVGTTLSFQSLTNSSAAPLGAALSNPISFVIAP